MECNGMEERVVCFQPGSTGVSYDVFVNHYKGESQEDSQVGAIDWARAIV